MAWWVVPGRDRKTDLVVQLGRRRYVAFLLDVESHAGRPDQDAATIRTESPGDNWVCVLQLCDNSNRIPGQLGLDREQRSCSALLVVSEWCIIVRY